MTDFTSDTPVLRARSAPPKREYYAYFAIIFLAALPLATLTWALGAARRFEMPEKGPLARAWTQARIITPQIFSA
ncbi:MAG: protein pufQ [Rhodobacterales bacterium]|nr:protein pufQ [Rhodobacterales bacterium]NCT11499.1 protein pufQ [Rhodobacterales bacterium]